MILIGASGFIGRHLLGEPLLASERIRCLARNPAALIDLKPNVEVVAADMRDEAQLERWLEPAATVLNLAFDRAAPHADNVSAARLLARTCTRAQVARLIHLSTAAVVGANRDPCIDETSRCQPVTPYESTKLAIEDELRSAIQGTELVIVRPTAVFGRGGKNLVKLARETAQGRTLLRYLRATLQGGRPMNLVSVQTVCAAIMHLAQRTGPCDNDVFIVSEDEARANNYRDVELAMIEAFGQRDYRWRPLRLPAILETGLRSVAGTSARYAHRHYRSDKLLETGFVKPLGFDEALRRYAAYLARQFRLEGEVLG